ncbi:MAG: heparinase II/III family protein [Bacteroidales bacterium]|nr:heparinase II/III family protein [Bacteroidales bacterium]
MNTLRKKLLLLFLFTLGIISSMKAQERNLLGTLTNEALLAEKLLPGTGWVSFPAYSDRDAWSRIPEKYRLLLTRNGEEALNFDWGIVKATDYLEFLRSGDRNVMQNPYFARRDALQDLVLAELAEGKGRFLDQIINGIWALSEQSSWVLSAHLYLQERGYGLPDIEEPVIDLFTGEVASLFSWTHHFLKDEFDKVDSLISKRIRYEIKHRVLDVYYERDDFWWMSFGDSHINNWNVWVNHNMLATILLMEQDPALRAKYIYKTMRSVDKFINFYKSDGGCDEGPSYWGHAGGAMFEYLEMLGLATGGSINIFDQEIIRNIGRYIYRAHVAYPYVINFADASAKSGSRPGIVYRYGKIIQDPVMESYGAFLADKAGWTHALPNGNLEAVLTDLFMIQEITDAESKEPLIPDFYLPDLQICGARDKEGSSEGFFFAAKGGHNQENHNHNDVGNFILYYNGLPAIIDVGVGTYTRQTFSEERYEIWTMQSQYHNTPTINGFQQLPGEQYAARNLVFNKKGKEVMFRADIAGAYPKEAMVDSWIRTINFKRGSSFSVKENFVLEKKTGETSVNFMTGLEPVISKGGQVLLKGDGFNLMLEYDTKKSDLKIEEKLIDDSRLRNSWGEVLYRLIFISKTDKLKDDIEFVIKAQ